MTDRPEYKWRDASWIRQSCDKLVEGIVDGLNEWEHLEPLREVLAGAVERSMYNVEETIRSKMMNEITDFIELILNQFLKGDQEALDAFMQNQRGTRYSIYSGQPLNELTEHGTLKMSDAMKFRTELMKAQPEMLRDIRVKDLESIVIMLIKFIDTHFSLYYFFGQMRKDGLDPGLLGVDLTNHLGALHKQTLQLARETDRLLDDIKEYRGHYVNEPETGEGTGEAEEVASDT